ncbi:hypothetical protein AAC387_Pa02g4373 [Persea americana]
MAPDIVADAVLVTEGILTYTEDAKTLTSVQIKETIIARRWRSALIHEGVTTANAQRVTIVMVGTTEQGVLPKNFRCTRSFQELA